ncbi:hypothetical protein [Cupriavidus lacunae]|uniref:hypothetical protein n=1 Tax=Cupriavidus lacunae TaxID=2666307 RepID=UPI001374D116|nr:hypothetical protein [Cupriavidus lacunae]
MNQAQMQIRLERAKNRVREIIAADLLGETVDANGKPAQAIVSKPVAHDDAKERTVALP